jgi:hypothetical protein
MKTLRRTLRCWLLVTAIFTFALLLSTGTARASKTIYDLNGDWSNDQNPNGAWSYNWNDAPISQFQTFWWGQAGWGYNWLGDGCVIKGSYFAGIIDPFGNLIEPAFDWQPGDVMMHALSLPYGGDSIFVNVRWTSPGDGWIEISGTAWDGEIFSDRDVAWMLIVGGNTIAQRQSVIGVHRDDAGARFDSNLLAGNSLKHIRVAAGDVVEFRVLTDTYYGHFVGINETITFHYGAGRD